ncbi:MAG: hypothetical protein IT380_08665 [Myxococcales bacterium]|nr:hypothetical protein [Myxococcales bacterium]
MADTSSRADLTSRARAADSWDAGLHADSDVGPIDVGLSVEPSAMGFIVDAPHVGQIRLALDVDEQGITRLTALSRRLADGREGTLQATDANTTRELAQLRARVRALDDRAALLESERDEARDRAALVMEEKKALEQKVLELKTTLGTRRDNLQKALEEATASLEISKAARLEALSDKEKLKAELEGIRTRVAETLQLKELAEADSTRALAELEKVKGELNDVRAARSTLEEQLLSSQAETEQAEDQASAHGQKVAALEEELAQTRTRLTELERQAEGGSALQAELDAARAQITELEASLSEAQSKTREVAEASGRVIELEAELQRAQAEAGRVPGLEAALAETQGQAARVPALEAAVAEAGRAQADRISELEQALAEAQLAAGTSEARLEQALLEARQAAAAGADDALITQLQSDAATLQQQLAESHEVVKAWEGALATEQAATAEAREVARQLKEQVGKLTTERDEARSIARQLHQKAAGKPGEGPPKEQPAKLGAERDRLALQVEALSRQLEGERSARARAVAERDALKDRLGPAALSTETEVPAVTPPYEPTTEPHNVVPPGKKKP